jgi:hypothetical protein
LEAPAGTSRACSTSINLDAIRSSSALASVLALWERDTEGGARRISRRTPSPTQPPRGNNGPQSHSRTLGHRTTPAYPHRDRKGAVSSHYAVTASYRSRYGLTRHFRKVRL